MIRSAGSHTPVDLLAADGKRVLAIQVKRGRYISKEEQEMLKDWAAAFGAKPVLAKKKDGRWVLLDLADQKPVLEDVGKHEHRGD